MILTQDYFPNTEKLAASLIANACEVCCDRLEVTTLDIEYPMSCFQ